MCALASIVSLSLHALPLGQPITRTLTSADGKTAELVIHGITGDQLIVQSPADAKARITLPMSRLSEADRQELETLRTAILSGEHVYEETPFITELCRDFQVDGGGDPAWAAPTPELWSRTPYFIFINGFNGIHDYHSGLHPFVARKKPQIKNTPVLFTYGRPTDPGHELTILLALEHCPPGSAALKFEEANRLLRLLSTGQPRLQIDSPEAAARAWNLYKPQIPSYWPALPHNFGINVRYSVAYQSPSAYVLRRDGSIATLRGKPLAGNLQVIVKALETYYEEVD